MFDAGIISLPASCANRVLARVQRADLDAPVAAGGHGGTEHLRRGRSAAAARRGGRAGVRLAARARRQVRPACAAAARSGSGQCSDATARRTRRRRLLDLLERLDDGVERRDFDLGGAGLAVARHANTSPPAACEGHLLLALAVVRDDRDRQLRLVQRPLRRRVDERRRRGPGSRRQIRLSTFV